MGRPNEENATFSTFEELQGEMMFHSPTRVSPPWHLLIEIIFAGGNGRFRTFDLRPPLMGSLDEGSRPASARDRKTLDKLIHDYFKHSQTEHLTMKSSWGVLFDTSTNATSFGTTLHLSGQVRPLPIEEALKIKKNYKSLNWW